jgi:hypothetical protein
MVLNPESPPPKESMLKFKGGVKMFEKHRTMKTLFLIILVFNRNTIKSRFIGNKQCQPSY